LLLSLKLTSVLDVIVTRKRSQTFFDRLDKLLSFVDQEELFNSGNFAERTYREDLKGFFDWNWLWYEQDLKSGAQYEQQLSSLKSIGSRILQAVKSLDLDDLNELS
jgi:hypothetical protein